LKKEAKERMGWDIDYRHDTNTDNPFGDGNLLATFVWSEKLDKEEPDRHEQRGAGSSQSTEARREPQGTGEGEYSVDYTVF
jgi:hypothetical protein